MRSNRVFGALGAVRNRYMLCQLASKATRKFHRPNTRVQETMNEVLDRFAGMGEPERLMEAAPEVLAQTERKAA